MRNSIIQFGIWKGRMFLAGLSDEKKKQRMPKVSSDCGFRRDGQHPMEDIIDGSR